MGNYELSYSYFLKCESWQIYEIPLNNWDILKIYAISNILDNKLSSIKPIISPSDEVAPSVCQNYSKFGWLCICENRNKSREHNQIFVEYCYPNNWEWAAITGGVFFYLKNSLYWLLQRVYIENLREEERKYNFGNFTASYCTVNSNFKLGVIFQNFTRAYKHKTCQLMIFPTTLFPPRLAVSTP